jgi:indole-3-glycerol phosphate synthase
MILDAIVANKKREIFEARRRVPLNVLKVQAQKQPAAISFAGVLKNRGVSIIAEVKKASPSRGVIRADFDPVAAAMSYAENGAAAISVLTDEKYFQGRLEYIPEIKSALQGKSIPVLRKDFIIDPYQVYESRAAGADALLLIVAILAEEQLSKLLLLSRFLGMDCLVEVHNEKELATAVDINAGIIGINNRNLVNMTVNLDTTQRLRPLIPRERIVVSESGISGEKDIRRMKKLGVDAVLIGEALMSSPDIGAKLKALHGKG